MTNSVDKLHHWYNFDKELLRFICKKVNQQDHCRDILQNVYLKVLTKTERIENAANVGAYLHRMAMNEINDYYRANPANATQEVTDDTLSENHNSNENLQLADCCLRPIIESLPVNYRDALIWTELEGWSQVALAKKLGISVSGMKSRVQRAREKLKEEILKCCNYEFDKYGNILSKSENPRKNK